MNEWPNNLFSRGFDEQVPEYLSKQFLSDNTAPTQVYQDTFANLCHLRKSLEKKHFCWCERNVCSVNTCVCSTSACFVSSPVGQFAAPESLESQNWTRFGFETLRSRSVMSRTTPTSLRLRIIWNTNLASHLAIRHCQ